MCSRPKPNLNRRRIRKLFFPPGFLPPPPPATRSPAADLRGEFFPPSSLSLFSLPNIYRPCAAAGSRKKSLGEGGKCNINIPSSSSPPQLSRPALPPRLQQHNKALLHRLLSISAASVLLLLHTAAAPVSTPAATGGRGQVRALNNSKEEKTPRARDTS